MMKIKEHKIDIFEDNSTHVANGSHTERQFCGQWLTDRATFWCPIAHRVTFLWPRAHMLRYIFMVNGSQVAQQFCGERLTKRHFCGQWFTE